MPWFLPSSTTWILTHGQVGIPLKNNTWTDVQASAKIQRTLCFEELHNIKGYVSSALRAKLLCITCDRYLKLPFLKTSPFHCHLKCLWNWLLSLPVLLTHLLLSKQNVVPSRSRTVSFFIYPKHTACLGHIGWMEAGRDGGMEGRGRMDLHITHHFCEMSWDR